MGSLSPHFNCTTIYTYISFQQKVFFPSFQVYGYEGYETAAPFAAQAFGYGQMPVAQAGR